MTIGNSVTSIGDWAFADCSGLTSVTIPNGVTSIGDGTFSGCSGLTFVTIPNNVTSIGKIAFSSCKNLKTVILPSTVKSIGKDAFKDTYFIIQKIEGRFLMPFKLIVNKTRPKENNKDQGGWQRFPTKK